MKVLLDTHALLWFALDDERLSARARAIISDAGNDVLVSPASVWEIAIKVSLGKYVLKGTFESFFERQMLENDFTLLPITIRHAAAVSVLPFHHRDPFDRLMAAQSLSERLPIISADRVFNLYAVPRIWETID